MKASLWKIYYSVRTSLHLGWILKLHAIRKFYWVYSGNKNRNKNRWQSKNTGCTLNMINRLSFFFTSIHFPLPPKIKFDSTFLKSSLSCLFAFLKSNVLKDEVEQINTTCISSVIFPSNHPFRIVHFSKIYDVSLILRIFSPSTPAPQFLYIRTLPFKQIDPILSFSSYTCHKYWSHWHQRDWAWIPWVKWAYSGYLVIHLKSSKVLTGEFVLHFPKLNPCNWTICRLLHKAKASSDSSKLQVITQQ